MTDLSVFIDRPGQPGAFGALMDEYALAAEGFCSTVEALPADLFLLRRESADPEMVSLQSICAHVVGAAYGYALYIRDARKMTRRERPPLNPRRGILSAMRDAIQATIDSAGRLVLPKAVRDEAGILPGMTLRITVQEGKVEIEPLPREVKIVQRGPLWVAVPVEEGPPLSAATVEQVLREVRERGE